MIIGPHTFPDTIIYEVQYQRIPIPNPIPLPVPLEVISAEATADTSTSSAPNVLSNSAETSVEEVEEQARMATPILKSLAKSTKVKATPDLVAAVNFAAKKNEALANLLHLAARGEASTDELKTLGALVKSMTSPGNKESNLLHRKWFKIA